MKIDPSAVVSALSAAGVPALIIAGLLGLWLFLAYGPKFIRTISGCLLEHKRFDLEAEAVRESIQIEAQYRRDRLAKGLPPTEPPTSAKRQKS
jgi:hypothetical protein